MVRRCEAQQLALLRTTLSSANQQASWLITILARSYLQHLSSQMPTECVVLPETLTLLTLRDSRMAHWQTTIAPAGNDHGRSGSGLLFLRRQSRNASKRPSQGTLSFRCRSSMSLPCFGYAHSTAFRRRAHRLSATCSQPKTFCILSTIKYVLDCVAMYSAHNIMTGSRKVL